MQVDATDFGIKVDGSDESVALRSLAATLTDPTVHYDIILPPGNLRYSDNRWLWGAQRFTLRGSNTTLACTSSDVWAANRVTLRLSDPFDDGGDIAITGSRPYTTGHLATIDGNTVTLNDPSDALLYTAGQRVLVHGFDLYPEFRGYPPNLLFFDYRKIAEVSDGVLKLAPVRAHVYDKGWVDTTYDEFFGGSISFGAPRVLLLDRPKYRHIRHARFIDLKFSNRPQVYGDLVEWIDCHFLDGHAPSMSARTRYLRCTFDGEFEVDKLVPYVEAEECIFNADVGGATGCDDLVLRNCQIGPVRVRATARRLEITSCNWASGSTLEPNYTTPPVLDLHMADNTGDVPKPI